MSYCLRSFQLESINLCLDGYDRYSGDDDSKATANMDDAQAMELVYLLRQHHSKWLRRVNLCGGHRWSKAVLFKVLKHLVPVPTLQWLGLPVEGLSDEAVDRLWQLREAPGGATFMYKLEKCGREFWELRAAADHYRAQRRPRDVITASLCRQGAVIHLRVKT